MKVYIPNNSNKETIGGGWTFLRNFHNGLGDRVHFVDNVQDCDLVFIVGVTLTNTGEIHEAKKLGKPVVFRVDNVPRKSRNKRSTPHERMKELASLSDVVIYQSEWAKKYCEPLCGEGTVIYNGVDTDIFSNTKSSPDSDRKNNYCFFYHGKNETKGFWHAHYIFQNIFRENKDAKFWFSYDFGRDLPEMVDSQFDFWNGEKFVYLDKIEDPHEMARIFNMFGHLIYPSIADACPNIVLEARACGLSVIGYPNKDMSATEELVQLEDYTLSRMCDEYFGIFSLLTSGQNI